MRTLPFLIVTMLTSIAAAAPTPSGGATDAEASAAKEKDSALAALEKKLHGEWRSGPCIGTLQFYADGTYMRDHWPPAGIRSTGQWSIQWNALPPTLVLHCKTSTDPADVNQTTKYNLTRLNQSALSLTARGASRALIYKRIE